VKHIEKPCLDLPWCSHMQRTSWWGFASMVPNKYFQYAKLCFASRIMTVPCQTTTSKMKSYASWRVGESNPSYW